MIRRWLQLATVFLVSLVCSQAFATHIQYADFADVSGADISNGDTWTFTFDLTADVMYLWEIDSPTADYGPLPDLDTADYMGSYDPQYALHYVTLRIDPNNKWSVPTSTFISLDVNGTIISDWGNPIRLFDWGVPGDPVYDPYNIADNDYKVTVTLTGLSSLENNSISVTNVNLEGCFDNAAPVPEPATLFLMGLGLTGFAGIKRKKRKS